MARKHLKSIFVGCAIILILASSGLVIYLLYLIKTNSNPAYLPQIIREKIADFSPENYDDLLIKIGVTGTGNGAYQDGDIVMIRPSTHKWSKREQREFLIVRVPKLTDKQKRELVKPMKKNEEIVKRRVYGVNYRKPLIDLSQIIKKAPSQISVIPENKRLVKAKLDPPKYITYLNKVKNYFFGSVKAATQVVHTIKEDGSGDYTTLASWEAGTQRDLVAADEIEIAQIDGTWTSPDTTPVVIDGWTTDADHYIRIYTTETARHDGKWNTNKYRLDGAPTGNWAEGVLNIYEDYVRVEGLQFNTQLDGVGASTGLRVQQSGEVRIASCIIKCTGTPDSGAVQGIRFDDGTGTLKIWNTLIYDWKKLNSTYDASITLGASGATYRRADGVFIVKNCIAQDCNDGFNGVFDSASDYNISDISGDAPGANSKTCTVSFADEANDDFHLAVSDTAARDAGTNLSGDSNLSFTDDIDGETRPGGTAWDIGADELKKTIDWSTNTAYDRSGQGNNGTITNMSTTTSPTIGKVGQALEFDGVNDYVDVGTGPTGVKTIAFWVYPETTTEYFVNLVSDTDYIWANAGTVTATGFTSPTIYVDGVVSNIITANKWQYIVITTDTAENVDNLDIGRTQDTNYLQGKMDEVRLYNRVLSAGEILDLYHVGARKFKIDPTKNGKTIIK